MTSTKYNPDNKFTNEGGTIYNLTDEGVNDICFNLFNSEPHKHISGEQKEEITNLVVESLNNFYFTKTK